MKVTAVVVLSVALVSIILATGAEYYRAKQLERVVRQPQKLSLCNILVAALVLGGVILAAAMLACGRENDPRRFVDRSEPEF